MRIYQKLVGACFECPNLIKSPFSHVFYCFDNDELIVNHWDVLKTCPLKTATTGDGDE